MLSSSLTFSVFPSSADILVPPSPVSIEDVRGRLLSSGGAKAGPAGAGGEDDVEEELAGAGGDVPGVKERGSEDVDVREEEGVGRAPDVSGEAGREEEAGVVGEEEYEGRGEAEYG